MNAIETQPDASPHGRGEILALRIKARLMELGFTEEKLAGACRLRPRNLRDIINGRNPSLKGRQRVTDIAGEELWPGITPNALIPAPTDEQTALLETTFETLETLAPKLAKSRSQAKHEAIHAEAAALFTPAFHVAFARALATQRMSALIVRGIGAVSPFREQLAASLGVQLPASSPGDPATIKLGADPAARSAEGRAS